MYILKNFNNRDFLISCAYQNLLKWKSGNEDRLIIKKKRKKKQRKKRFFIITDNNNLLANDFSGMNEWYQELYIHIAKEK